MFTPIFTTVLATALLSQAIVTPNEPGPNENFTQTCHIGWARDTVSPTAWQNMAIELMTGSNENMTHLTTVATGQDGTKDGTFDYTCPQVMPNAPIYFYQFTAPGTPNITWTTRFTITAPDGSSTDATETEQADGQTVHWGKGALVDPSSAIPAPNFDSTSSSGSNSVSGASPSGAAPVASGAPSGAPSGYGAPLTSAATTPSAKPSGAGSSGDSAASSSSAPQSSGSSAAVRPAAIDMHVWPIVAALTASAMTATILL